MTTIKELRKSKNLTQKELSEIIGTDQTAVSKWELGKALPDTTTAIKLSEYFDVSIDYLLGRSIYYYPDSIKQSASLALSEDEKIILNNFRTMRPDLRETFIKMSETLAQPSDAIAGSSNKKKA